MLCVGYPFKSKFLLLENDIIMESLLFTYYFIFRLGIRKLSNTIFSNIVPKS